MAPCAALVGIQSDLVFTVNGLLEPAWVVGPGFMVFEYPATVTGCAGGRCLVFVRDGILSISVEHGRPHGVVKGSISIPEVWFRTADALVLDLDAPGFFVIELLVAVVVGLGAFAVIPL